MAPSIKMILSSGQGFHKKKNISQSHKNKIIILILLLLIIITERCGLKSVEIEYKQTQVKAAVKLYSNKDPTMQLVW